jgi:hypothetical protein
MFDELLHRLVSRVNKTLNLSRILTPVRVTLSGAVAL